MFFPKTVSAGSAESLGYTRLTGDPQDNQRVLPVIMYHQILKHGKSSYIVTPAQLEKDLAELKKRGYETVLPSEIIAFAEGSGTLPPKPVLISFDDGHYNNVYYGKEILEKHCCKAVLNIIGRFSDFSTSSGDHSNPSYSHLTWEQIAEAQASGVFEIGHHTFNMHNYKPRHGIRQKPGESDRDYQKALSEDTKKLQDLLKEKSGIESQCYAYPFGIYNDLSERVLAEMGFKLILTCYEQRNLITSGEPSSVMRLCRFNRSSGYGTSDFFDRIEKTKVLSYNPK